MSENKLHALVTDAETGQILIDEDLDGSTPAENRDAVGTSSGPVVVHGPVYHGVKVWVAPANRVHDWEPEEDHVFIQWTDRSSSLAGVTNEKVHTSERPLPGGGVSRFLVAVS